jgi:plasmid stabilization system protein ParE
MSANWWSTAIAFIYHLQDDEVVIAAVIHGKRMLTATEQLGDHP